MLHEGYLAVLLGVGIALFSFVQVARVTNYFGLAAEVYPAVIVSLTNRDREQNNLGRLAVSPLLSKAAQMKADDMAAKGYFSHTSPEGMTPWYWFAQAGYPFMYAGENLAINYDESGEVHTAWLNSPGHRANVMNEYFTEMGVAVASGEYNGKKTTFIVELFGMPAAAKAPTVSQVVPKEGQPLENTLLLEESVAGEQALSLSLLEETDTFVMAKNNDRSLEPGIGFSVPEKELPWTKRFILQSGKIAGLTIQIILVVVIISTAGMVAREYEKHHKKHMACGALLVVVLFTMLFVGELGVFHPGQEPVAQVASLLGEK